MRPVSIVGAALLLAALAACSSTTPDTRTAAPQTGTTTAAAAAVAAAPAAAPDGSAAHPFTWGSTHHGKSLDFTISAPKIFHPSDTAFSGDATGKAVYVTITMSDHASIAFNPMADLVVSGTGGQSEAQELDDPANGIGEPSADILPGKTLKWKHAFVVPTAAKDLTVSVGTTGNAGGVYYAGPVG